MHTFIKCDVLTAQLQPSQPQSDHARKVYNTVVTRADRAEIDRLGEFACYVVHVG